MTQVVDVNQVRCSTSCLSRPRGAARLVRRPPEVWSSYRAVYDTMLRDTTQASDPFDIMLGR